jgi:hypothetical protein
MLDFDDIKLLDTLDTVYFMRYGDVNEIAFIFWALNRYGRCTDSAEHFNSEGAD